MQIYNFFYIFYLTHAQTTVNIDFSLQFGIMDLLSNFFSDPMLGMQIINHGCWCAKLHPMADYSILGGPYHSDEIDEICKEWQKSRKCSRIPGQICENVTVIGTEYQVIYNSDSFDAFCPDIDPCLQLTCQIDLFFINQLLNTTSQNGFTPEINAVCEISTKQGRTPSCDEFPTTEIPTTIPATPIPTTLEPPLVTLCRQVPMDLMFVMDGSGSVQSDDYLKQINFMRQVTSLMTIGSNETRVGLVQFSDAQQVEFGFVDDEVVLDSNFDGVLQIGGGTNTGAAIQYSEKCRKM